MQPSSSRENDTRILLWFFGGPTLMLVVNFFLFPYPQPWYHWIADIPLFAGLLMLGAGWLDKNLHRGSQVKTVGWVLFALFWSTYTNLLYFSEGGDIFNAAVCVIGVYVLVYLAYHEWMAGKRGEHPTALAWIAGATFLAGIIYFSMEILLPVLSDVLIIVVANQTVWLLHILGIPVTQDGATILYHDYPVRIIFACTAIQSLLLFVGMLGAIPRVSLQRKAVAMCATVIPVYLLNLVRNAGVVILAGGSIVSFDMAHNVIGKVGSLLALIALLFLTFRLVPSLYDEIMGVLSLPKQQGAVERFFRGKSR